MKKTQEELNELKKEVEALKSKLAELSDDELKIVTGGYEWKLELKVSLGYMFDESSRLT